MLAYVNQIRKKANARPLKYNSLLTKCAQRHSDDQYRHHKMSHVGSDGSSPGDRVSNIGYRWRAVAENVAWNQRTVKEVVLAWYHSPGHYKNMINKEYDEFGAGVNHLYWTQVFGRASSF
ncbi:PR-1-like protein [Neoconidiobolus thromboides FSU 785]|nr:PR-1-like protein [Neoconidiobolus thromboides FSU 785]